MKYLLELLHGLKISELGENGRSLFDFLELLVVASGAYSVPSQLYPTSMDTNQVYIRRWVLVVISFSFYNRNLAPKRPPSLALSSSFWDSLTLVIDTRSFFSFSHGSQPVSKLLLSKVRQVVDAFLAQIDILQLWLVLCWGSGAAGCDD